MNAAARRIRAAFFALIAHSRRTRRLTPDPPGTATQRISRSEHSISRAQISKSALNVLYGLRRAGYEACLVGGGVRDLLLGFTPKDFDVATDATPEQIRDTFRNARLIGRRFRLAHVRFGAEIIEVATYRGHHDGEGNGEGRLEGDRIVRDNVFGTREEDALRRDFTVNALFYDISDFSLVDHVGGFEDLQQRRLRMIGDPDRRYREDPVRLLRAVRLATKLGLEIEPATQAPLHQLAGLLSDVPQARLFDEILKMLLAGCGLRTYEALRHYDLLEALFAQQPGEREQRMIAAALRNTDERIADGRPVTPAFLFAVLLWPDFSGTLQQLRDSGENLHQAIHRARDGAFARQSEQVNIPKRFALTAGEIWELQLRLERRRGGRAKRLMAHPRFRAAYDFLVLRAEVGEDLGDAVSYWSQMQEGQEPQAAEQADEQALPRRRRRRRPRRRRPADAS